MRYDRIYEPPPVSTPWPLRPIRSAGGLTAVGLLLAFVLALPAVLGGVLLSWEAFGP